MVSGEPEDKIDPIARKHHDEGHADEEPGIPRNALESQAGQSESTDDTRVNQKHPGCDQNDRNQWIPRPCAREVTVQKRLRRPCATTR
jgi:hypothetical protein